MRWLGSMIVPWIVVGLPLAAVCERMMNSSMREVLHEEFVRTALSKGISNRRMLRRHAVPGSGRAGADAGRCQRAGDGHEHGARRAHVQHPGRLPDVPLEHGQRGLPGDHGHRDRRRACSSRSAASWSISRSPGSTRRSASAAPRRPRRAPAAARCRARTRPGRSARRGAGRRTSSPATGSRCGPCRRGTSSSSRVLQTVSFMRSSSRVVEVAHGLGLASSVAGAAAAHLAQRTHHVGRPGTRS